MAGIYDWLLVIGLMMIFSIPVVALLDDAIDPGNLFYRVALILIAAGFFILFWSRGGQTTGMKAWRLQLVNLDDTPVDTGTAAKRFVFACVAAVPGGLGYLWLLWDKDQLSWHDRWSGTTIKLLPKNK